jgi:hypothetical protein
MTTPPLGIWSPLKELLEQRLRVIADHDLRARDAAAHLEQVKEVSLQLAAEEERLQGSLPPRLRHFLTLASYSKALDWILEQEG